ncbi:MAG TPA: TonB-dependent receptor [Opitutaceae bacterium]
MPTPSVRPARAPLYSVRRPDRWPMGRLLRALLSLCGPLFFAASVIAATRHRFDVPAGDATQTLRLFSQQSGEQILFPAAEVRGVWTRSVHGAMPARDALDVMLAGTGLLVVRDEPSGAMVVKRQPPRPERAAAAVPAPAARAVRRAPTRRYAEAGDDPVILSPFEVRSEADTGYRATNAVSATRTALPIRDLPMSITAFPEEFIADQKAYDLYDVVKWAPGVHQDNVSPQGWIRYNIRGFTAAAVQRNGFDSFRFVDPTNVARIEVVKGPASLLYGQINPGGVINYITKRPEPEPSLQLTASVGDHGYARTVIDGTGPVPRTGGRLLYRAIAMYEDIQQFQVLARGHKRMLAPSATWRFSERASLTVEYEHFERIEDMLTSGVPLIYVEGTPTIPYPGLPGDFSYAGEGDYQDFVADALSVEFTARLGEHLVLRGAWLDSYWDQQWRATGVGGTGLITQPYIDAYYPPSAELTPADAMYRRNRYEHQWGGERSLQVDLAGEFRLGGATFRPLAGFKANFETRVRTKQWNNPNIAGHPLYLKPWDLRNPATWDRSVPFGEDGLVPAGDTENSSDAGSLYGLLSVSAIDDRLHLLGGYARYDLHHDPTRNLLGGTSTPEVSRAANVPQLGALYRATKGLSAFVSYSESFRANPSLLRVNGVASVPAMAAVGRGLDVGIKADLFEGRLSGTLSVYRVKASPSGITTVTNGVDANGSTLFTDVQGGAQRSEGLELELFCAPTPGFQVLANVTSCDAIYERHPTQRALDGTPLVATPKRTVNVWGKYLVRDGLFKDATLAAGLNYVGSMAYVGNNPFMRFPSYTTLDVTLGYRFAGLGQHWNIELSVKNVTDERYYASATSWGFPRHAILSVRTRF